MLSKKKTFGEIIDDLVQEVKALHARGDFKQAQRLILDTHMIKHIVSLQDQLAAA